MLGIQRYVLKHILNLNNILYDIKLIGGTIKALKSKQGMQRIVIIGFKVDKFRRYPIKNKVNKITKQLECRDAKGV